MRRRPLLLLLPALAVLAVGASACGGGSTTSSGSGSNPSGAGVAPAAPGLPAVARATDLKVAPIIAPGKPPPPTKLTTRDLVVGSGQAAGPDSKVTVQYVGTSYPTGKVFDSSWARGQAATFTLTGVVPGFQQGIVGMKPGGRREITIPPGLGYGASGQPPVIQPNETLVFVVDLKAIG